MKIASVAVALFTITASVVAAPIQKISFTSGGKARVYYLLVPERPVKTAPAPMPLIVTLHGSGRDGRILVEHWQKLAEKEGIVMAGPDATNSRQWEMPIDGPDFLRDLANEVKTKTAIDPRRVYLFGHSAGAVFALQMGVIESKYLAAVAVHAGAIPPENYNLIGYATRKIPEWIAIGTRDQFFPLDAVHETRDALQKGGIPVEVWEIERHTHDYYTESKSINDRAWQFLSKYALDRDPEYTEYAK